MWPALVVPYAAAAVLLGVAGVPKVRDPGDLVRAVRSVGMPFGRGAVRAFAVAEVVVAVAALVVPSRLTAALLALMYAGFTAFVVTRAAPRRRAVELRLLRPGRHPADPGARAGDRRGIRRRPARGDRPAGRRRLVGADRLRGRSRCVGFVALVALVGFLAWQVMAVLPTVQPAAIRSRTRRRGLTVLAVVIAEGVAIALLAVLVLGLLRSHALILRALHELGAGLELEKDAAAGGTGGAAGTPGPVAVQIEPGVVPATRGPGRAGRSTSWARTCAAARRTSSSPAPVPAPPCWRSSPRAAASASPSGRSSAPTPRPRVTPGSWSSPRAAPRSRRPRSPGSPGPGSRSSRRAGPGSTTTSPGSPYFVLVEDGVVTGEGSATNWASVRDLLQQAVDESAHARAAAGRTGPGGDPARRSAPLAQPRRAAATT